MKITHAVTLAFFLAGATGLALGIYADAKQHEMKQDADYAVRAHREFLARQYQAKVNHIKFHLSSEDR
jgi:Na+-translocating ferredoxin:NAD+ oxidoreductase RnfG subunit